MELYGKIYTFKNGYGISKAKLYNGFEMTYLFAVVDPNKKVVCGCGSWDKAVETIKKY